MDQILSSIYLAVYSPTGYLAMISGIRPDIELLSVFCRIFGKYPALISDEFYIQLIPNHALAKKGNDALNLSSELPVKFP